MNNSMKPPDVGCVTHAPHNAHPLPEASERESRTISHLRQSAAIDAQPSVHNTASASERDLRTTSHPGQSAAIDAQPCVHNTAHTSERGFRATSHRGQRCVIDARALASCPVNTTARQSRTLRRITVGILTIAIRSYQLLLAPLLTGGCRHIPSCSEYSIEAMERHGLWHGLRLTAARIWRCRPKGTFGYDPVP